MSKTKRLAILTTHQIQYHAPWFRALAARPEIDLEVMFCHSATAAEQSAAGFGVEFNWDVSLVEGYRHRFLQNISQRPDVSRFWGLDTPEISEIVRSSRFDAVLINGWHYKSAWQAIRACWSSRTPVMVRSDSHLRTHRALAKRLAKRPVYNWFIPRLNACLPVGTWSREYFRHYGAKDKDLFVVPHVIDDARFRDQAENLRKKRNELRSGFNLKPEEVVFLFVGKLIQVKRPLSFVQAIAQSAKRNPRVAGLMVGSGPLQKQCEDFSRRAGAPVRYAGFLNQSEITKAYVAADALVLPSVTETWGLVVNEAMTCGLPCFISDQVGCGPDLVMPGQTGDVFPSDNVPAFVEMICHYTQKQDSLVDMGHKARTKVAEYSVDNVVNSTLQAVSTVSNRC